MSAELSPQRGDNLPRVTRMFLRIAAESDCFSDDFRADVEFFRRIGRPRAFAGLGARAGNGRQIFTMEFERVLEPANQSRFNDTAVIIYVGDAREVELVR